MATLTNLKQIVLMSGYSTAMSIFNFEQYQISGSTFSYNIDQGKHKCVFFLRHSKSRRSGNLERIVVFCVKVWVRLVLPESISRDEQTASVKKNTLCQVQVKT